MAKTDRQKIVVKLDKIVSEIVRARDKKCVVCGRGHRDEPGKRLGSGHVFSRKAYSTRWDITPAGNVHAQCWPCNRKHVFDSYPYFEWYRHKFSQKNFEELRVRFKTVKLYKTFELEELYERLLEFKSLMRDNGSRG